MYAHSLVAIYSFFRGSSSLSPVRSFVVCIYARWRDGARGMNRAPRRAVYCVRRADLLRVGVDIFSGDAALLFNGENVFGNDIDSTCV